jgi:hypothetical protein
MNKLMLTLISLMLCNVLLPCFLGVDAVPTRSSLAVVWEDDFNDENIDDWETMGINFTDPENPLDVPANFSLDGGILRAAGNFDSHANHISTVTTGTWSFDVDCVDSERHHFYVAFMRDRLTENLSSEIPAEYGLMIVTDAFGSFDDDIVLYRRDAGSATLSALIDTYSIPGISGWYHFDITRDSEGRFFVYINGTLQMEGVDNTHTTSEYFGFYSRPGPAIDNIVVSDSIDEDQVPPFLEEPADQSVFVGDPVSIDLDATDYSGIDHWWVNDTTHFSIDSNGVITNATVLSIGDYGLEVSVNDTNGYTRTVSFDVSIVVNTSGGGPPPDPIPLMLIGVLGIVIVVVIAVVILKRR